jgi:hypothetical protein
MKISRNGKNPRPAGLGQAGRPTPMELHRATVVHGPEHMIKPIQGCLVQESQVETERLEPS